MVSSRSSTVAQIRSAARPPPTPMATLCNDSPAANSRWITWSCRSAAIRSRSSSMARPCCSARASPSSIATAAWLAKPRGHVEVLGGERRPPGPASDREDAAHALRAEQRDREDRTQFVFGAPRRTGSPLRRRQRTSRPPVSNAWPTRVPCRAPGSASPPRRRRPRRHPSAASSGTGSTTVTRSTTGDLAGFAPRSAARARRPRRPSQDLPVIAADACSHSPRDRAASYSRAFSIATPAVAASACASSSSSRVNSPRTLSVR